MHGEPLAIQQTGRLYGDGGGTLGGALKVSGTIPKPALVIFTSQQPTGTFASVTDGFEPILAGGGMYLQAKPKAAPTPTPTAGPSTTPTSAAPCSCASSSRPPRSRCCRDARR